METPDNMDKSKGAEGGGRRREALTIDGLGESVQSLRGLFQATLIALVVLAGSLAVFLLREVSLVRRQVTELNQFVTAYETTTVPMMRDFRSNLIEFARLNPDFAPILGKYFSSTNFPNSPKVMPAPEPIEGQAPRMPALPEN